MIHFRSSSSNSSVSNPMTRSITISRVSGVSTLMCSRNSRKPRDSRSSRSISSGA
ncbi:Uncharacterised protein [Vibrio cholerae]|nr:Uncharacterised protein [Vibrio cholerae]